MSYNKPSYASSGRGDRRRPPNGLFAIWDTNPPLYIALHALDCCHANKCVAVGIWYT